MYNFGVMLSHWQGKVDFISLKDAGVRFIVQKASEGSGYIDPSYEFNVTEARKIGLGVIAFHYWNPVALEANLNNFLTATMKYPPDLYEIDWEEQGKNGKSTVSDVFWLGFNLLERTKQIPLLYTNPNFGQIFYRHGIEQLSWMMLHVAHYNVGFPAQVLGFAGWDVWQRSKIGRLAGIKGNSVLEVSHMAFNDLVAKSKML